MASENLHAKKCNTSSNSIFTKLLKLVDFCTEICTFWLILTIAKLGKLRFTRGSKIGTPSRTGRQFYSSPTFIDVH